MLSVKTLNSRSLFCLSSGIRTLQYLITLSQECLHVSFTTHHYESLVKQVSITLISFLIFS